MRAVERVREIYDRCIDQVRDGNVVCGERGEANDSYANCCLLNCCANVYGMGTERKEALIIAVSLFIDYFLY